MTNLPASADSPAPDETQISTKGKKAKAPKTPKRRANGKAPRRMPAWVAGVGAAIFNFLAALFLLLSLLSALAVAAVFNGVLAYIPGGSAYMPPTEPAIALLLSPPTSPAGTPGIQFPTLPPVWTPTITPTVTLTPLPGTPTPEPSGTLAFPTYTDTFTPSPTATATRPTPTRTPSGPTPKPTFTRAPTNYTLQSGSPTYLANFINTSGCNWFGIVGRAFGLDGNPVINLTVHLEGGGINADTVTGSGPSSLGPGSYQFPISDHPIETSDTYRIQLRNNTGTNLSDIYTIVTHGDCSKNLVMVNFVQNH